jgi:hypothetical protein
MNLLEILGSRVEDLPEGDYIQGLKAVLQHIDVAGRHLERGQVSADDTAFTDAIYRTNQAFEGSLKEAFRVLTAKDPTRESPNNIENYLQQQNVLRPRVLAQLTNYRKEWRNPSTHDYRLDFDEDEALLAIVTVSAFAIVLIDQIAAKLSFDKAKAATPPPITVVGATKPLVDIVADAVEKFQIRPAADKPQDHLREAEIAGALAGYLSSAMPSSQVDLEPRLKGESHARPDLLVTMGEEQLLVEVKRVGRLFVNLNQQYIAQVSHYIALSGIREALVYVHSEDPDMELTREEHFLPGANARVIIIGPRLKRG